MPATERDVIYSLALSDHHLRRSQLAEIAEAIAKGAAPLIGKEQEDKLRPAAREYLETYGL